MSLSRSFFSSLLFLSSTSVAFLRLTPRAMPRAFSLLSLLIPTHLLPPPPCSTPTNTRRHKPSQKRGPNQKGAALLVLALVCLLCKIKCDSDVNLPRVRRRTTVSYLFSFSSRRFDPGHRLRPFSSSSYNGAMTRPFSCCLFCCLFCCLLLSRLLSRPSFSFSSFLAFAACIRGRALLPCRSGSQRSS